MNAFKNGKLVLSAVAAVALVAAGAAFAASKIHSSTPAARSTSGTAIFAAGRTAGTAGAPRGRGDDLAAAATYLGLSQSDLQTVLQSGKTLAQVADATSGKSAAGLIDALVTHETAEIAQAVKDGKLTQAQADTITAGLKAHITADVNRTGPGPGGPGGRGPGPGLGAAATYLGLSQSDLQTALQSGKTLAQVADATSGKSAAGLIDALVTAETAQIAQAVKDGRLTQAQADQLTANLKTHITAEVNGTAPPGRPDGRGHGHGDGLATAATYLGLSQSDLMAALQSGKTLAQVADATSGKSAAGLIDALVTHETAEIAQAVKDGNLTQAQADQITADLTTRITAMVNDTAGPGPGGGPGFGPRRGGGGGAPPASQPPAHI